MRIIAGQWRGRKLAVADVAGLRPTGDRVRETLFNWLQSDIAGRHCLDLFAGSGALGFEALSRHAASVTFIEPDTTAFQTLQENAAVLGLKGDDPAILVCSTAQRFLAATHRVFDIVFIDPPFETELQWVCLEAMTPETLSANAIIYVESPSAQSVPERLPNDLIVTREKLFGDVCARLLTRTAV